MQKETTLLQKTLIKICVRYEKRGSLAGSMKLGQDLDEAERLVFEDFFGLTPLTYTVNNELKLSFERLLARKDSPALDGWLDHVYQKAQRVRLSPTVAEDDSLPVLLKQLRLEFPQLSAIHHFLAQDHHLVGKCAKYPERVRDLFFKTAEIVTFLVDNEHEITLSELGAQFYGDSKRLRQGEARNMVQQWLHLLRPALVAEEVWDEFLVVRDRLTITALIYAPLVYVKGGREFDWIKQLYHAGEPAVLSWFHLSGVSSCRLDGGAGSKAFITCENEAPFSQLLRENTGDSILFTSGFPNRAVRKLYSLLGPHVSSCKHWGDSDPAGLRIAAILHGIHPLKLWRCDHDTLQRYQSRLLPLADSQKRVAELLLKNDPGFPFMDELVFTNQFGWLEQESWLAR